MDFGMRWRAVVKRGKVLLGADMADIYAGSAELYPVPQDVQHDAISPARSLAKYLAALVSAIVSFRITCAGHMCRMRMFSIRKEFCYQALGTRK